MIDVRDMLCAQALAVVAQAVDRLAVGEGAHVLYNAEDVKRDLLKWAQDCGHRASEPEPAVLRITRHREHTHGEYGQAQSR